MEWNQNENGHVKGKPTHKDEPSESTWNPSTYRQGVYPWDKLFQDKRLDPATEMALSPKWVRGVEMTSNVSSPERRARAGV